jgi:hypothetical protein
MQTTIRPRLCILTERRDHNLLLDPIRNFRSSSNIDRRPCVGRFARTTGREAARGWPAARHDMTAVTGKNDPESREPRHVRQRHGGGRRCSHTHHKGDKQRSKTADPSTRFMPGSLLNR